MKFALKKSLLWVIQVFRVLNSFSFFQECTEQLEEVCQETFKQDCQRSFETECTTVDEEQCTTDYEEQCETVYKERCSTDYENKCRTEYVDECQGGYVPQAGSSAGDAGYGGQSDCRSVPKEICEAVAVPNCRQIADEQVKLVFLVFGCHIDGAEFWISCHWLAFFSILSCWQLIQNTVVWRQCVIWHE